MTRWRQRLLVVPILGIALGLAGCVDEEVVEKIVYKEKPLFEDPPAAAQGFLGYSKAEEKLSVCGNCHVGQQSKWEETAHADAWAGLQASGHAQDFCADCHTASSLGNAVTETAVGYASTKDARYHDVQCESCHGPGLAHVTNPDAATKPLASLAVAVDATDGCGECHQDTHHPYVEEWATSAHGTVPNSGYAGGREQCAGCHTGEDALRSWGINVEYAEKDQVAQSGQHLAITCGVCHDPHAAHEKGQLRFSVETPNEEENLCMKCHHKRGVPDPTTFRGPHSPEGPVLLGYGGWWPPNLEFAGGEIVATHGSEANPKLCAGCHLASTTVNDAAGNFVRNATGHLFNAIPCLDAQGVPTNEDCELQQRSFKSCTTGGCHGSEAAARSAMITAEMRVEELAGALNALIAQIPSTEFNEKDGRYTTGEGAQFNAQLAVYPGSVIHNPFLIEALLTASIKQVRQDYQLAVPPGLVLDNVLASH